MSQLSQFTTYRTGILQARAHRNLRHFMVRTLGAHQLTSTEWSIIGVISEETKNGGIRVSRLAILLDVEMSFVTNMVKKLMQRGYAKYAYDEDDGRVRLIVGTKKTHQKVAEIEKHMRAEMREWLSDVDHEELAQYINVLQKISNKTKHSS